MIGEVVEILPFALPAAFVFFMGRDFHNDVKKNKAIMAADEAREAEYKQQSEWYETIKLIGKEETEKLMVGPLRAEMLEDGTIEFLRDEEHSWKPEKLMGQRLWNSLHREWYKDEYCEWCKVHNCKGTCWQKQEHDAEIEKKRLAEERKKRIAIERAEAAKKIKALEAAGPQITTLVNKAGGGSNIMGYRISYKGESMLIKTEELKAFQMRHNLTPNGVMTDTTRAKVVTFVKYGIPIKADMIKGGVSYTFTEHGNTLLVVGVRRGVRASAVVLAESFQPLWEMTHKGIVKALDQLENKAKPSHISKGEDSLYAMERELHRLEREMMRNGERLHGHRTYYNKYNNTDLG